MIKLMVSAFLAATALQANVPATATAPVEAPAAPATEETAPAAPAAAAAPAKPKKICRRLGGTGSRLESGKVCKTAEQWKRFDQEQ